MSGADRRTVLGQGAATFVLPFLSQPARAAAPFVPPSGPMRFSRRLERSLGDGAVMIVVRDFAIRFVPAGGGFRVEGEQIDVAVEAPERLAEFARLERERVETSLLPLVLDGTGRIVARPDGRPAPQLEAAVAEALARLDRQPLAPAERASLQRLIAAVHEGAGRVFTELPPDLFAPPAAPRIETREVILPEGGTGRVTVSFSAESDPATRLMREARREVVTAFAGTVRRTLEIWHLVPLG